MSGPADAVQTLVIGVVHDASDVIAEAENLGRSHRLRIDLVDDRAAVRPVFGNRNPDMATVVVNPAGMVHRRALAQRDVGDEITFRVDLEEVPDALSDIPIVAFSKLRVALRRNLNVDRRDEEIITGARTAARVLRPHSGSAWPPGRRRGGGSQAGRPGAGTFSRRKRTISGRDPRWWPSRSGAWSSRPVSRPGRGTYVVRPMPTTSRRSGIGRCSSPAMPSGPTSTLSANGGREDQARECASASSRTGTNDQAA